MKTRQTDYVRERMDAIGDRVKDVIMTKIEGAKLITVTKAIN